MEPVLLLPIAAGAAGSPRRNHLLSQANLAPVLIGRVIAVSSCAGLADHGMPPQAGSIDADYSYKSSLSMTVLPDQAIASAGDLG